MKISIALVACAAVLVLPGSALAANCAPPGNSGVNQYFETIPGANCDQAPGGSGGSGGGHSGGGSLSKSTSRALSHQGAAGKAVANLVASTGTARTATPSTGGHRSASPSRPSTASPLPGSTGSGSNPVSGLLHPIVTGSTPGGLGVLLPVLLAAAAVLVFATALLRRRRVGRPAGE